ncbi:hypothetical protein CTAYLR_004626 [Chrysophaeum taylorii]|uniref:FIST domain-containing protein n=1 Tax=Chrysophaeum taylorii TaxID=2483200 RepID=A0AAD7UNW9_9STRA|nr:hypothetical protein CTAYLR_004626 [Chrysophaeum taylorii]
MNQKILTRVEVPLSVTLMPFLLLPLVMVSASGLGVVWHSTCSQPHPAEPLKAVEEALAVLKLERKWAGSADEPIELCVMTVGSAFESSFKEIVEVAQSELGPKVLISVVGGGVIGGGRELENTAAVALLAGNFPPDCGASPFILGTRRGAYNEAAWRATAELFRSLEAPNFLLFGDPLSPLGDATSFVDECAPSAVVVGGVSCPTRSGVSSLAVNGDLLPCGSVAGVALRGSRLELHAVTAQGAVGVGPTMKITRGRVNLVAALDDEPALDRLRKVAIQAAERSPRLARLLQSSLLVGLAVDASSDDFLVRTVVGATPDGAVAIGDDSVKPGRALRVHVRDAQAAKHDLDAMLGRYSLERTFRGCDAPPFAAFLFSCAGRGHAMYGVTGHDSNVAKDLFPDTPLAGFFANGEIGPIGARLPGGSNNEKTSSSSSSSSRRPRDATSTGVHTHLHGFTSVFAFLYDTHDWHQPTRKEGSSS